MMEFVLTDGALQRLASTLLHFLWQGAVLAAVAAVALRLLARQSAEIRYAVAAGALLVMTAAPFLTFVFNSTISSLTRAVIVMAANTIAPATGATETPTALIDWNSWMPSILMLWFAGVAFSTTRLTVSWWITLRLRRTAELILPGNIHELFRSLTSQMGFVRSITLMKSRRIATPLVVGWIRPMVLLPVRALTGLDEDQLRAVLAHELAHIRRHDFLVNVLQRCVESFLFYHPGVWWLSARIRAEREHCCDDLAVRVCGDPLVYAQALVQMEQARGGDPQIAMAAGGSGLTGRVLRVLGRESGRGDWRETVLVWMCLLAIVSVSVLPSRSAIAQPVAVPVQSQSAAAEAEAILPTARALLLALAEPQPGTQVPLPAAQPATTDDTGSIEGIVVRFGTDQPVVRAFVTLYPDDLSAALPGLPPGLPNDPAAISAFLEGANAANPDRTEALINGIRRTAETDENGKFTFTGLKAGRYRVAAARNGYVRSEYGQRRPGSSGASLAVVNRQTLKDLRLVLIPAAAITGRVYDSHNEPLRNVSVRALRDAYEDGARVLKQVQETKTNDLGEYRLSDLQPGRYFVSASFAQPGTPARMDYVSDRTVASLSIALPANPLGLPTSPSGIVYRPVF
jgi:beta-lactamase regulating signal transducer with metallopeptidase domain